MPYFRAPPPGVFRPPSSSSSESIRRLVDLALSTHRVGGLAWAQRGGGCGRCCLKVAGGSGAQGAGGRWETRPECTPRSWARGRPEPLGMGPWCPMALARASERTCRAKRPLTDELGLVRQAGRDRVDSATLGAAWLPCGADALLGAPRRDHRCGGRGVHHFDVERCQIFRYPRQHICRGCERVCSASDPSGRRAGQPPKRAMARTALNRRRPDQMCAEADRAPFICGQSQLRKNIRASRACELPARLVLRWPGMASARPWGGALSIAQTACGGSSLVMLLSVLGRIPIVTPSTRHRSGAARTPLKLGPVFDQQLVDFGRQWRDVRLS